MINLHLGLKYWNLISENYHEWEKLKPISDPITGKPITLNGVPQLDNHYTDDEINELQMTDKIAVSLRTRKCTTTRHILIKRQHMRINSIMYILLCHF
jgi:hypothetical protein